MFNCSGALKYTGHSIFQDAENMRGKVVIFHILPPIQQIAAQNMDHHEPAKITWQRHTLVRSRQLAALALTLLVAGCASFGQRSVPPQAAQQSAITRPYHRDIDLSGRLSVHFQQNGQDQAVHGNFNWSQSGERVMLALFSPLGQTIAKIEVTPQQATLTQTGRPTRIAADADALATEALGWPLLAGLHDWLQGFARGSNGKRIVATPQQDDITTSDGWHLRFVSWQDNDKDSVLFPRRIDLARNSNDNNQAGDVGLRIVIDHWQPH
jgi:outer membrane lipoprotein LolB